VGTVRASRGAVIVADDEESIRSMMALVLQRAGFDVFTAADGAQCLSLLSRVKARLVVLDIHMPGRDGAEVAAMMREGGRDAPPILFATTDSTLDTVQRAMRAGGADYLVKPFTPETLVARVEACLRGRRGRV
jgi:two-component system OmpR family response regulator